MNLKLLSSIAAIFLALLATQTLLGVSAASAETASASNASNASNTQEFVRLAGWRTARSAQDDAQDAVRSGRILPLSQVLQSVRNAYPGQLLDADLLDGSGRPVYRIKLLSPNGNVTIIICDAKTGRVLKAQRGGR